MNQEPGLAKMMMQDLFLINCGSRSNETYKDDCQKKASKFPNLFMLWGYISFKEIIEIANLFQHSLLINSMYMCTQKS